MRITKLVQVTLTYSLTPTLNLTNPNAECKGGVNMVEILGIEEKTPWGNRVNDKLTLSLTMTPTLTLPGTALVMRLYPGGSLEEAPNPYTQLQA